jgi:hypothetical protein
VWRCGDRLVESLSNVVAPLSTSVEWPVPTAEPTNLVLSLTPTVPSPPPSLPPPSPLPSPLVQAGVGLVHSVEPMTPKKLRKEEKRVRKLAKEGGAFVDLVVLRCAWRRLLRVRLHTLLRTPVGTSGLGTADTALALLTPPPLASDPVEHVDFAVVASASLAAAVPLLPPDAVSAVCDWVVQHACETSVKGAGASVVHGMATATLAAAGTSEVPGLVAGLTRALAAVLDRQVGTRLQCGPKLWPLLPFHPCFTLASFCELGPTVPVVVVAVVVRR